MKRATDETAAAARVRHPRTTMTAAHNAAHPTENQKNGPSSQIDALAAHARAAGRIALDTEFVGEGRYRTLLCLVQVAVPLPGGGQEVALIDPLDGDRGLAAAAPLADVLADPRVEVVMHSGRQDVALLRRELATDVTALFDTQVAAGFAGMPAQRSYDSLLADVLGVEVAKTASFTRWEQRPLSAEQLGYAREDVLHMLELAQELKRRLRELGRLHWALQECEPVAAFVEQRTPELAFERLPRIAAAGATARAVALELCRWRERTAQRRDRPVQSVLPDAALMEIARRTPGSESALRRIRGLPVQVSRRSGNEILAAVRRGRDGQAPPRDPRERRLPPDPGDAPLIALCEAVARARAREAGLAYELLASRADLQAIVQSARAGEPVPGVRTLDGWRREIVGAELLRLIAGDLSLTVRGGALRVSENGRGGGGEGS